MTSITSRLFSKIFTAPDQAPSDAADAARFLAQATFGADLDTITALTSQTYADWLDAQEALPVSLTKPYMEQIYAEILAVTDPTADMFPFFLSGNGIPSSFNLTTAWMRNIVHNDDQLRQRVAWSLSQIIVVSHLGAKIQDTGLVVADFYDVLMTHALGNFRDLLLAVTLHPAMAFFLTSLGNEKPDPSVNRNPDENYARESMQLFSIGLWELNDDGTRKVDGNGEHIPTYDNDDINNFARVFTGLWFEGMNFNANSPNNFVTNLNTLPLAMFEDRHDVDEKVVFAGKPWQETFVAGQTGMQDIEQAVDMLFNHANTPAFISRQLIQFLVKSEPEPAYVGRVAAVFKDNGAGVRGDLFAVVKAILLDTVARTVPSDANQGRLFEPMVRITRLVKAFKAGQSLPNLQFYRKPWNALRFGQWPMCSPSVFNFYAPSYTPPNTPVGDAGSAAPVFQIVNPITVPEFANYLYECVFENIQVFEHVDAPEFVLDIADELLLADDTEALIDHLALLLCPAALKPQTRTILQRAIARYSADTPEDKEMRVRLAIYILAIAPDAAILQ